MIRVVPELLSIYVYASFQFVLRVGYRIWARGYKTLFVLNSVEQEILNAHKYKNIKKSNIFLGSGKPRMLFSRS